MTNADLQSIIDAAAKKGGVAKLPAGTFLMHDALHLRSGVRVVGSTDKKKPTVLVKAPSVQSPLADYLGYGHYEFTVKEPEKFRVGMGVHILDNKAGGFYTTVATITERRGDLFFISRMLNHDYGPRHQGKVISLYPVVEADGVSDASIENVVIDGNDKKEQHHLNGCRGAGVFLIMSHRIKVLGVEVKNFRGDAISFQQCSDITVDSCDVHHNHGGGIHPGSGTVRYVMSNNHSHDNGGCGIFYCLRTTHSICENNVLERNGWNGISVGERDTDHLIRNNTVRDNGCPGIEFRKPYARSGDRVRVIGNTVGGNCTKKGHAEILVPKGLEDIHIDGNTITTTTKRTAAIAVAAGAKRISIVGNTIDGRPQTKRDVIGAKSVSFTTPKTLPPVGPDALPLTGAAHLAKNKLATWAAK